MGLSAVKVTPPKRGRMIRRIVLHLLLAKSGKAVPVTRQTPREGDKAPKVAWRNL